MRAASQAIASPTAQRHFLGTPAGKPLYLFADAQCVCDAAGDVLLVRRSDAPTQRYPLVRITRIVSNVGATWTGRALASCFAKGITITWVDGHGHALGNTQPRQSRPDTLDTLLETYVELKDWSQRFDNWCARRRLDALVTSALRHAEEGRPLAQRTFAELKRAYVCHGSFPEVFETTGESLCHALTVDRLHKIGLRCRYHGFDGSVLDLAAELSGLLWAEMNFDAGTLVAVTDKRILLVQVFESWSRLRENRLMTHIGDLRRHIAREVDAWH